MKAGGESVKGGKSSRSIGSSHSMKEFDTWYQSGLMEASLVLFR